MSELIQLVQSCKGRLVLSGDTRQHGPVEVSDAMAAMEKFAGLKPAELAHIKRQNPALGNTEDERNAILAYRNAVAAAANGQLKESFVRLDNMTAITECQLNEQQEKLASEYVRLAETDNSVVVISQTWSEVHRVNERVRAGLKSKRLLEETEHRVEALEKLDLTNAQKRDERFYVEGRVVVFNQKVHGQEPGTVARFIGMTRKGIIVEANAKVFGVLNRWLDRISICRRRELRVARGERLQLKANRRMSTGAIVTNGEIVTVASMRADGAIDLTDGRTLDANYREFVPGYAVTSYGSQGKTADYVLFSDSTIKAATNDQQWYVTISRGRKGIRIFTPDKSQLCDNLARSGQRPLALDLAGFRPRLKQTFDPWLRRVGRHVSSLIRCAQRFRRFTLARKERHEQQTCRMLGH